ncbi:hypothetical protein LPJ61_000740 [Coemansia biformis]|uniref:Uncharacterized protein n=1 Tax=Coemansia biformis TaxID=1286918 RepID=A0A9W7YB83_9FUNG|nr:hypothetical protein LPJ61_000740 [Coemansia biformis]
MRARPAGDAAVERRIVVAPELLQGVRLRRLRLPHPRTDALCSFYADTGSETVLEAVRVDLSGRRSWLGDGWVSASGSATMLTPVDPLFLYLSLLTVACKRGDEWRFVDIDSIGLEAGDGADPGSVRALLALHAARKRALDALCDTREVGDSVVVRVDQRKVLAWLCRKCDGSRLPDALLGLAATAAGGSDELARTNEMALLVAEYLPQYWREQLVDALGLAAFRRTRAAPAAAPVYDAPETYAYGAADPQPGVVPARPAKKDKPPTAKERQLAEAAKRSKPITSFFGKQK